MGLPARVLPQHQVGPRASRFRLRAVPNPAARTGSKTCRAEAATRQLFTTFVTVLLVVSVLGIGRVWLSVQAAEASLASGELRSAIKEARYEGDMLEVRLSALTSPSRIRAVASQTMSMTTSREVTYLDLNDAPDAPEAAAVPSNPTGPKGVVADVIRLAAGEAQVLLVGDIALSGTR